MNDITITDEQIESKLLKKRKKDKRDKAKKTNIIDKIFKRVFLSSLLLLTLVLLDNSNLKIKKSIKYLINHNINFMKIGNLFSGSLGIWVPNENDITVFYKNSYDFVKFDADHKVNNVYLYSTDGVKPLTSGIVTKITRNSDNTYNIYVTDSNGITYGYLNLISYDFHIYSFVSPENIIGLAKYDQNETVFTFNLTIEEKGEYYDFNEKTSD